MFVNTKPISGLYVPNIATFYNYVIVINIYISGTYYLWLDQKNRVKYVYLKHTKYKILFTYKIIIYQYLHLPSTLRYIAWE